MGRNNFINRGQIAIAKLVLPPHVLQFMDALEGTQYGRLNGVLSPNQNLGDQATPFGTLFANSLNVAGNFIDLTQFAVESDRIISGVTSPLSNAPKFISVDGTDVTILGTTTPLQLNINGRSITLNSDITLQNLSIAPSAPNNTAKINDDALVGAATHIASEARKYAGECDFVYGNQSANILKIDEAGAKVTAKIGQWVAFSYGVSGILYGFLEDAETLVSVQRRFFRGVNDNLIDTEELGDNSVLTLLNVGWIFADADAIESPEITYISPFYSATAPSGGNLDGRYWFNVRTGRWLRFENGQFIQKDRMPIGIVVTDDTGAMAYRCFDFAGNRSRLNTTTWLRSGDDKYITRKVGQVAVDREIFTVGHNVFFDKTTDGNEAIVSNEKFYFYIKNDGGTLTSAIRPVWNPTLGGYYHPVEYWRCVCETFITGGNFNDEYSYFPYQRYHSFDQIDFEFKIAVRGNKTYAGFTGVFDPIESIGTPNAPDNRNTDFLVTLKRNLVLEGSVQSFLSDLNITLSIAGHPPGFNSAHGLIPAGEQAVQIRASGVGDFAFILRARGNQAAQIKLDNELSKF